MKEQLPNLEARFRTIFEQAPFSIQILGTDGRTLAVNRAFQKQWSIDEDFVREFILKEYSIFEDPILTAHGAMPLVRRGFEGEVVEIPPLYYDPAQMGRPGRAAWVGAVIYPLKDEGGKVREVVLIHSDVTERREIDKTQGFLSRASEILQSTLDYAQVLERLAAATIPDLADGCIVDVIEGGAIRRIVTQHRDPTTEALMRELQAKFPPRPDSPQPSARVIRSGEPELLKHVDAKAVRAHTINEEHYDLIRRIGINSHLAVPLQIRGEIIGAISLLITTARPRFSDLDLMTARELARRAAIAIDNARLYRDAQKAIRQRDEFISVASHELKTPITTLKLQAQMADRKVAQGDGMESGYARRLVDYFNRQVRKLERLVDDMLDVSRIATGRLGIDRVRMDLAEMVRESTARFRDTLDELKIPLTVRSGDALSIDGDPFRLDQVLSNLLTNAIRYGEGKPIEVSLTRRGDSALLEVIDQGRGVAPEDQRRIFERFERAVSSSDVSGLGLGLYISEQIVRAHGGTIGVRSELGKGSTFAVVLPLA